MLKRTVAAIFGALVFGIVVPVTYLLLFPVPQSLMSFVRLALLGAVLGALLGVLFPRVFGFFSSNSSWKTSVTKPRP